MSILALNAFSKHFGGIKAVNNLSLSFEEGKITGIIGPNGSGKSTLINLITGVIAKDKGSMILSDDVRVEKIHAYNMRDYGITRTFQSVRIFEQMSVFDNVMLVLTKRTLWASLFEKNKAVFEDRAKDIIAMVGLDHKIDAHAEELSYGQRKLLEIARVIATDANIIFFDEPYAGLFPEMVKKVSEIIQTLKKKGKTIILVEHNMDIIRELCDHLIVLDSGTLLAEGKPTEVLARRDVIEAYLGE